MKLTFDEVIEMLDEERFVNVNNVQAKALARKVYLAEWHLPGCLSESQSICTTKEDAIGCACFFAEGEEGIPRGMKTALRRCGRFDTDSELYGRCINTVNKVTLSDLL